MSMAYNVDLILVTKMTRTGSFLILCIWKIIAQRDGLFLTHSSRQGIPKQPPQIIHNILYQSYYGLHPINVLLILPLCPTIVQDKVNIPEFSCEELMASKFQPLRCVRHVMCLELVSTAKFRKPLIMTLKQKNLDLNKNISFPL